MYLPASEVHSESSQTSKLKLFMKIIKEWKPLTIFKKSFIIMFDWVLNAPVWFMLQCGMSVWRPSSGGSWSFFFFKKISVKEDFFTAVAGFYCIQKTFRRGCFLGISTKFREQFSLESIKVVKYSCTEL